MEKLTLYVKESYYELINKVTWPTWAELQSSTTLVLVASLIFAAAVFVMDIISNGITSYIYDL